MSLVATVATGASQVSDFGALSPAHPLCHAGCESVVGQCGEFGLCRSVRGSRPPRSVRLSLITSCCLGGRRGRGLLLRGCRIASSDGGRRRCSAVISTGA